jgi:signal transduction histidine kinase
MIRDSLGPRSRRALGPVAAVLLGLFLVWVTSVAVHAFDAASRGALSAAALESLHELRAEIDRLQVSTGWSVGMPEAGGFDRNPTPAARDAEATVRRYFRRDQTALRALDQAAALRLRAMESARAAFLLGVDRVLPLSTDPRSQPAPGLLDVHRDLAEACAAIEQLEALCVSDLRLAAAEAGRARIALLASLGVIAALLGFSLRTERLRRHHQRGARLVEDMLEAYSRRLEAMNVQLEQVNLLKTQFLANTSHELLTPLNGVMGSLEAVRSGSCSSREEERDFLDQAYQSAERLLALIRDLLDLCHLEEGNLALRRHVLGFGTILERELAAHRPVLAARGLVLLVTPPSDGWPRVTGDPERVTQVLHHLLANAVKFTDRGSLRVTGRTEGGRRRFLRVEVADTGIGIEPGKLGQVFDLFSQADGSNTRRFGGAGLGLTLSRHLVQGMGGRIGIESDGPGRGTRAWFTLPLAEQEAPPVTASEPEDGQSRAA